MSYNSGASIFGDPSGYVRIGAQLTGGARVESQLEKIFFLNSRVEEPAAPPVTLRGCA
jgi:hypothetical protein